MVDRINPQRQHDIPDLIKAPHQDYQENQDQDQVRLVFPGIAMWFVLPDRAVFQD